MRTLIPAASATTRRQRFLSRAGVYLELTKPRVVALIVFTTVVGMFLATPQNIVIGAPPAPHLPYWGGPR